MKALVRRLLPAGAYAALAAGFDRLRRLHPERRRRARQHRQLNRGAGDDAMVLRPGLRLAVDPRARASFEHFCFRSLAMARELDAFLAAREGRTRLVDVGALHGLFALAFTAGRPAARALAIDPSPVAQETLRANLARNPDCQVEALQLALGDRDGTLAMRQEWEHLEALPAGAQADAAGVLTVEQITLDSLLAGRAFVPDLLKIDVEGYELAVLRGARATLEQARPWLFLELHPQRLAELGASATAVVAWLAAAGYSLQAIGGGSLQRHLAAGRVFRAVARSREDGPAQG